MEGRCETPAGHGTQTDAGCPRAWAGAPPWRGTQRLGRDLDRPARVRAAREAFQGAISGQREAEASLLHQASMPYPAALTASAMACSPPPNAKVLLQSDQSRPVLREDGWSLWQQQRSLCGRCRSLARRSPQRTVMDAGCPRAWPRAPCGALPNDSVESFIDQCACPWRQPLSKARYRAGEVGLSFDSTSPAFAQCCLSRTINQWLSFAPHNAPVQLRTSQIEARAKHAQSLNRSSAATIVRPHAKCGHDRLLKQFVDVKHSCTSVSAVDDLPSHGEKWPVSRRE